MHLFALLNIFSSVALKNYPCLLPTSLRCQDNYFVSIRQTAAPTAASSPSETNISMRVPSHGASTSDVTFSVSTSYRMTPSATSAHSCTCQRAIVTSSMHLPNIGNLRDIFMHRLN